MLDVDDCLDAVVIDNGTWMIKAGYASGKTAQAYERTVVGRNATGLDGNLFKGGTNMVSYGEKACVDRHCELSCPMDRGTIVDWDDMESIWEYIFTQKMRDGIKDRPVLITEVPGNCPENRQKMVEIMMEKFRVPALYITDPAGLALISSGRLTGAVLDVGGSVTHVTTIYQGSVLPTAGQQVDAEKRTCRSNISGNDVTYHLSEIVRKKLNGNFKTDGHALTDIEGLKHCLYEYMRADAEKTSYRFSDGTSVSVDSDMIGCGDILFNPEKIGSTKCGIDTLLSNAIHACEDHIKTELFSNIILSGGTTLTPGVVERIKSRMEHEVAGSSTKVSVIAPPERRKSSWLGGSIIAGLEIFPKLCKTREDYYEKGWTEFFTFPGFEVLQTSFG